jgi:hypothetical protein
MSHTRSGCVVCGEELVYGQIEKLECFYCHKILYSNVKCGKGHFVCARDLDDED